jgi:CRISPR type III-associated protein (TIGR04423 family)
MIKDRSEVVAYINSLKDYEGYVQFSHRAIDLERDLFPRVDDIELENKRGFVYEAHFCNGESSIMIRQQNAHWVVSETKIDSAEFETFYGIAGLKVKMAQIWREEPDELCEGMRVKKLQKVVFAGFERGES